MAAGLRLGQRSAFIRRSGERAVAVAQSGRVALCYPRAEDYESWATVRGRSRDFLSPWEPTWPEDELTHTAFRRRLRLYVHAVRAQEAHPFFVFRRADRQLIGGLTLSNIKRGVTQSCALGYWVGAPYARNGYMTEAVKSAVEFAFARLALHRIEAACLPSNTASQRLLRKCGFQEEGYARRYLKINGAWQDHVLFAVLDSDPRP